MSSPGSSAIVPLTVKMAAGLVFLTAAWQFVTGAFPAFVAGDAQNIIPEILDVVLPLLVVWGLVTLRRWAWWLAVISAVAGFVIPAVVLGLFDSLEIAGEVSEPELFVRVLAAVATLSLAELALLFSPSCRAAFRSG